MQSVSLTSGQPTKNPVCHHTSCQPTTQGQPTNQPERAATSKFNNPSCSLHRSQQTLRRINHSWPMHWCSVRCARVRACAHRSPHSHAGQHLTWQMQASAQMFAGNLWKKGFAALKRTISLLYSKQLSRTHFQQKNTKVFIIGDRIIIKSVYLKLQKADVYVIESRPLEVSSQSKLRVDCWALQQRGATSLTFAEIKTDHSHARSDFSLIYIYVVDSLHQASSLIKSLCEQMSLTVNGDKSAAHWSPSPEYTHKAGLVF